MGWVAAGRRHHLAGAFRCLTARYRSAWGEPPYCKWWGFRNQNRRPHPDPPPVQRELTVLTRMADGKDVASIARELSISAHTCRDHVKAPPAAGRAFQSIR